jgi:hypothetical protein
LNTSHRKCDFKKTRAEPGNEAEKFNMAADISEENFHFFDEFLCILIENRM